MKGFALSKPQKNWLLNSNTFLSNMNSDNFVYLLKRYKSICLPSIISQEYRDFLTTYKIHNKIERFNINYRFEYYKFKLKQNTAGLYKSCLTMINMNFIQLSAELVPLKNGIRHSNFITSLV